ncbi:MAG TPA: Sec-independent protein translocase subunit TatA [Acidimicrobiia bacterium]
MPNLRWQELLIIVVLVLLLFGAKRLPDAARGVGRSLRIFKAETKGLVDDHDSDEDTPTASSDKPSDRDTTPALGTSDQPQATGSDSPTVSGGSETPDPAPDRTRTDG